MGNVLNFKRMMLAGLMLFAVSGSVFADNVNEEKTSVNRSSGNPLYISASESDSYSMEVMEGEEGYITIVPAVGYTTNSFLVTEGGDCITIDNNSRGLVIRFIAQKNGVTKLKVTLIAIGGGSNTIEINITINIKSRKGKQ